MFEWGAVGMRLKGCPRCKGDQNATGDQYGKYWECLQCGHQAEIGNRDPDHFIDWRNLDETRGRPKSNR